MVNPMGEFIEQTKAARLEREKEKKVHISAVVIQKHFRGFLTRRRLYYQFVDEFNEIICDWDDNKEGPKFIDALEAFRVFRRLLWVIEIKRDLKLFEKMCRYIISTMFSSKVDPSCEKIGYVTVAFDKHFTVPWICQLKIILLHCSSLITYLKPENNQEFRCILLSLNMMVTFTSTSSWERVKQDLNRNPALRNVMNQLCTNVLNALVQNNFYSNLQSLLSKGLCKSSPSLNKPSLSAIMTLSFRPMIYAAFNQDSVKKFVVYIMPMPGLIHHLAQLAPETLQVLQNHGIFNHIINLVSDERASGEFLNSLEANYALCLLANLINLSFIDQKSLRESLIELVVIIDRQLERCQKYVSNKQSSLTHWHPILGYFAQKVDPGLHESFVFVKRQLQYLWSAKMITIMFFPLFDMCNKSGSTSTSGFGHNNTGYETGENSSFQMLRPGFLMRALERTTSAINKASNSSIMNYHGNSYRKFGSPDVHIISLICSMYVTATNTLTQVKMDILSGLCYKDLILPNLWRFISSFGPKNSLQAFLDHLITDPNARSPEFQPLVLFCDCATYLITILDEKEFYEEQRPFTLHEYLTISSFLNTFVFKIVWNNLIDLKNINQHQLFNLMHSFLMVLYKRDCRRGYAPPDHWLIKEIKVVNFIKDLENGKKSAQILMQKVPHIIPHKERVVLFRKHVFKEKLVLGLTESACASPKSILITVHRSRIAEDGYQQLAILPPQALKGVIRVKFINEQGLDEAGVDQDGVFKEFLEETIKQVFDPSLNLFKVTSEQRLYPSPTSYVHEIHLSLFEFVGKMIGKAVYEGIVVDVPFASFFLSQVLGHQHSILYSSIDELPSLDPELYRSLTYIKHYEGDVADLDLTFSVDEDCMGKIVTHELIPGGRMTSVTNENKINYIHLMAHFRVHRQIHEQTSAFIRGFRCIVNPDWLAMFSTPEFQRLISGDNNPIDLSDLRRNTKYYGGFHNNHRVINWFWDILENDFKPEEHRLLLKFVTSCSKPPLLGFAHLKPQFSIRCVEVSEDQDVGDTVGSVLRGFFTIRRKNPVNRLPTSSTCFNLLKLPNYQKKSTLRDKLRYAIRSNTGFELS